ncbi:hypothetical protein BCR41DRAFT_388317, partial [Lobosporangium transversale]
MKQISYIKVTGGVNGSSVSLSDDGSLAAISVKGRISIYETFSGVKLGDYSEGQKQDKRFEVVMDRENFMVFSRNSPDDAGQRAVERKIVRIHDMKVIRTFPIHKDYSLSFPSPLRDQFFVNQEGPIVNIVKMSIDDISSPDTIKPESLEVENSWEFIHNDKLEFTSDSGNKFVLVAKPEVIRDNELTVLNITRVDPTVYLEHLPGTHQPTTSNASNTVKGKGLDIPLGPSELTYSYMYLPASSRLVLITGRYMQMWRLVAKRESEPSEVANLELVWGLQTEDEVKDTKGPKHQNNDLCMCKITNAMASKDGTQFALEFESTTWQKGFKRSSKQQQDSMRAKVKKLIYPYPSEGNFDISEESRISQGIRNIIEMYISGSTACQETMIQYLKTLIRPTSYNPVYPVSCIFTLCGLWTYEERKPLKKIMEALLPLNEITWIPGFRACTIQKRHDPLEELFKTKEAQPAVMGVASVIMDYCVRHANNSRNLSFLSPIFGSLEQIMAMFPDKAFDYLEQIAYIRAKKRHYIIDNHEIAYPPMFRLKFWNPPSLPLSKIEDPIMQLDVLAKERDNSNNPFTQQVYMASFDALWSYKTDTENKEADHANSNKNKGAVLTDSNKDKEATHANSNKEKGVDHADPNNKGSSCHEEQALTTWWKSLYHMILLKFQFRNKQHVKCHNFKWEFFDNPAIAALVAYKWNTIGFNYWLGRFAFQCVYYTLVLIVAFIQVYYTGQWRTPLIGLFIAIIVMSV